MNYNPNKERFKDPKNKEEILEKLKNCPTMKDVMDLINQTFPEWFVGVISKYSDDYPHLTENWQELCKERNVKPAQIVICQDFFQSEKGYSVLNAFIECLTIVGFSVRRNCEYFPCSKCHSAIPTKGVWMTFQDYKDDVVIPAEWKKTCSMCD